MHTGCEKLTQDFCVAIYNLAAVVELCVCETLAIAQRSRLPCATMPPKLDEHEGRFSMFLIIHHRPTLLDENLI